MFMLRKTHERISRHDAERIQTMRDARDELTLQLHRATEKFGTLEVELPCLKGDFEALTGERNALRESETEALKQLGVELAENRKLIKEFTALRHDLEQRNQIINSKRAQHHAIQEECKQLQEQARKQKSNLQDMTDEKNRLHSILEKIDLLINPEF